MALNTKKQVVVLLIIISLFAGGMNSFAQVTWTKYENNPVLETGEAGSWDSHGAVIASIAYNEGIYKAWYIGYDEFENDRVGYATSPDGINWTKDASYPFFPLGEEGSWDERGIDYVNVVHVGGTYHMWYIGEGGDHYRIGYAFSADGINWEKHPGNPVLDLGDTGSWDDEELLHPSVVYDGELYHMWYNGIGQSHQHTGYATSTDGITWEKYSGNPVLTTGEDGSWDDDELVLMCTVYHDNTFHMLYGASDGTDEDKYLRVGYATSTDGIHWEKDIHNPVLDIGDAGAWDSEGVIATSVIYDSNLGIYKMWYGGLSNNIMMTGYATAPAGSSTGIEDTAWNNPESYQLNQNFPNPFNNQTSIQFLIPETSMVELTVHNVLGQQVRTMFREAKSPGTYNVIWDGRDDDGRMVNSGLYLYRMTSGEHTKTCKLMLLK